MTDSLVLDLVNKHLVTDHVSLYVGYDVSNDLSGREITKNYYGRKVVKPGKGSVKLGEFTSSTKKITEAIIKIYDEKVDHDLLIRRINICADRVIPKTMADDMPKVEQIDLFGDSEEQKEKDRKQDIKEEKLQQALLKIKEQYGKNAVLKAISYEDAATARQRNKQIGGHRS